jgi:hypothetical protein
MKSSVSFDDVRHSHEAAEAYPVIGEADFLAEIKRRLEDAARRLDVAEKALDEAERSYKYWDKLVNAYKVIIAHEEWLDPPKGEK